MTRERHVAAAAEAFGQSDDVCVEAWLDLFSASAVWPPGSYLCQQGNEPDSVYLLVDGFVKLVCADSDGEELVIALKRAPAILGATAVTARRAHATSIVTGSSCRVRYCSVRDFLTVLEGNAQRLLEIARLQSLEIETLTARLLVMGLMDAETRFLHLLPFLCGPIAHGDSAPVKLPLKQYEMASFIGVTPEHLCRIIGRLVKQGTIRQHGGRIVVDHPNLPKA